MGPNICLYINQLNLSILSVFAVPDELKDQVWSENSLSIYVMTCFHIACSIFSSNPGKNPPSPKKSR
jgi:hypothetical protein